MLLGVVAWAAVQTNSIGGFALVYPISRTSEIDVNLWPAASGLRVVIWHQDTGAATNTRLAAFTVPVWLVLVLGGSLGGMLVTCLLLLARHVLAARPQ